VAVRGAARLALAGCALAVSHCAWGVERTVYLPGPIPGTPGFRFEQAPSDADAPVDWRHHGLTHGGSRRTHANLRSTPNR
jgi:hypothetical protein